jgi:hypothetical protein
MNIEMENEEIELWKMCDVRFNNRLQSILAAAYMKKPELLQNLYSELMKRYNEIDIEKLDDRFPKDVIKKIKSKIVEMGSILGDYEKMKGYVESLAMFGMSFRTPRYEVYRSKVKESERKG